MISPLIVIVLCAVLPLWLATLACCPAAELPAFFRNAFPIFFNEQSQDIDEKIDVSVWTFFCASVASIAA